MQHTDSGNTNTHPSPSKRQIHKYCCSEFSLRMIWLLTGADILACSGSLMRLWSDYAEIHIRHKCQIPVSWTTNIFL